ncbi:UDP-3-O-acyl-N-acetylglucosamine deacetylase [Rhodophyticola porphyridii]|uniref:UDP-3-O-acyl-N-acetylglucosamine deacetylase n=1 Tax=Rhodophyticola porphyridii TaxID=1852017 RepID=A0A3L9YBH7_9RHOB|nr:UDP-3-O-acyl-N-acetylglucosamine deacetylase [Rhodophyticola porphyridii]RMA43346.1 UDP-3-O-acyl-N-acetylglucosamine deacetylase [Rhodophyticola porphyridii]
MQATLRSSISFAGVGLHTGHPVRMTVRPAAAHFGIWFQRTDIRDRDNLIPARFDLVPDSRLCTKLQNEAGVEVSTIEHLMAALAGCGIHNALVEMDGPEVPILDGSAAQFVRGFLSRGIQHQGAPIHAIEVLKTVTVTEGDATATISPDMGLTMSFTIDFADAAIGRQTRVANLANGRFVRELCDSRTFCRQADVDAMQANGLALGGIPGENAVVFDGDEVTSPGGLRHADEAVRHKMLDALGDLALAGAPLLGRYEGVRAGHMLTNRLLRVLFSTPGATRLVECSPAQAARLPGVGVNPTDLAYVA